MIFMVEEGSLGNQLFQYLALERARKDNEKIILFGFDQLKATFDLPSAVRFIHIKSNSLKHLHSVDYQKLKRFTQQISGISVVGEDQSGSLSEKRTNITFIEPSWFQNSKVFSETSTQELVVKRGVLNTAVSTFDTLGLDRENSIALHVRAGDYRVWPSKEHPAILGIDWYVSEVARLRRLSPDLQVLAFGNEPEFTAEVLKQIPNSINVAEHFATDYQMDFCILSFCRFGIISASTFSLWSRFFAHKHNSDSITIAPKYWAGHALKEWYPRNFKIDFVDYH